MKQDFYNQKREGIQVVSIRELASRMHGMELDGSLDIYTKADKKTDECFGKTSIKRCQWNGTEFFLIKDERNKVHVVDYAVKTKDYIEDYLIPVLNNLGARSTVGVIVSRMRSLDPKELYEKVQQEQNSVHKVLLLFRNETEMEDTFGSRIYSISDIDGKHLCYLFETEQALLYDQGRIVETCCIEDMHFQSDWAVANGAERETVLAQRIAIIYTEEVVWLA